MTVLIKIRWHYNVLFRRYFPFFWSKHLSTTILGKHTDFCNPRDLNEKIQWLMFYTDTSQWTLLADKYRVRKYVENKIGADNLIPLIGKWDKIEDINFDVLPEKFVIKPNNGSYDTIICTNKDELNIESVKKRLSHSLTYKFGYENAEIHYTRIKPCIIAEELLEQNGPGGLIDYKIWCFNGKPHCVFVCANRDNIHHKTDFVCYDLNWNKLENYITSSFKNNFECPKPIGFDKMLAIASKLSEGLPQARVDLYNINGNIYFGEITLTSNFGMMTYFTPEALTTMGSQVSLPKRNAKERISTFIQRWFPHIM